MAAPPQGVERPDDARSADEQVLERRLLLPAVPLLRRPERLGIERGVRVGDDRGDRVVDARRGPRLVDQRLELRLLVERSRRDQPPP
ncbi:MAG TPA: hypothetical protein VGC78_05020 [Gaiellaceae bacterium]